MGNSPPKRAAAVRELERFTTPTGLYPTCPWDVRIVRRLILEKRVAPRFPGRESCESCFTQECPICFMFYPGVLNVSTCCKKPMCTECYLQVKSPHKTVSCPYCNHEPFGVKYAAPAVINLSSIYTKPPALPASYTSPVPTPPTNIPGTSTTTTNREPAMDASQHFASVEERERIRDDLRSQLQLTHEAITTPPPRPSMIQQQPRSPLSSTGANFIITSAEDAALLAEPRYIIASPADAARLEEMMIMEAIRRSMRDLMAPKDGEEEESGEDDGEEDDVQYEYSSSSGEEGEEASARSQTTDIGSGLEGRVASDYELLRQFQALPPQRRPSSNPFDNESAGGAIAQPQRRESASWNPYDA